MAGSFHAMSVRSSPSALRIEEQHQREMIRIHEMWQATKTELRNKTRELEELNAEQVRQRKEGEAAAQQIHGLTLELRDKLRFTELQLAGAREEGSSLATNAEELRQQLAAAHATISEQRDLLRRQELHLRDLQGAMQLLEQEKQARLHPALNLANRICFVSQQRAHKRPKHTSKMPICCLPVPGRSCLGA